MNGYTIALRTSYSQNNLFKILCGLFAVAWLLFYFSSTDHTDWWIENILVFIFFIGLYLGRKRFIFSDKSLVFLFIFLVLHIYGARMAYTMNEAGEYLQNSFHLTRNPYDRIVHFSFGFLILYPMLDVFYTVGKQKGKALFFSANMAILCLATVFELIEWGVAAFTDAATGETYVATQGDPWDAQKDIILALVGSVLLSIVLSQRGLFRNSKNAIVSAT